MAVLEPNSPWRNLAQKYGLHSRIAIPFHVAGAVKGILSVYGEATQLFGEDDIALLQNIGDDIGYYVATYETGQRVRNAEEAQRLAEQRELELRERAILALAQVIEQRDPYTAEHQRRVAEIAVAIARQMRLDDDFVSELALGAKIHDLGKIAIPSDLLSRSGKLSDGEMALVREHVRLGHDIVHNMKLPENIAMPVLYHHERLDGSGYPEGLKGDEIPLSARIIAVADTLEAMAAHRPYRAALGVNTALNILREERGIRYDSAVVDACLAAMKQGDLIERLQLPLNSAA
jgi:HD-GYP domain-containing protein (c-di-GMP phosphodiesterase class II)